MTKSHSNITLGYGLALLPLGGSASPARWRKEMSVASEVDTWSTRNRTLAAWLSMFIPIEDIDWDEGFIVWHFAEDEELRTLVTKFRAGKALVEPKRFMNAYRAILHDFIDGR